MRIWNRLWRDETGAVLTAEAVLLGTVGVLSAVVGLNSVSSAVNDELHESALAFRSLDQSFAYRGHSSSVAWTAGSYYFQPSVESAQADLCGKGETDLKAIKEQIDAYRKQTDALTTPQQQPEQKKQKEEPKKKDDGKKKEKKNSKKRPEKGTVQIDEPTPRAEPNDLPVSAAGL